MKQKRGSQSKYNRDKSHSLSYLYIHIYPLPSRLGDAQKTHPKTTHSPTPVPTQMPATFITATLSPARAARVNRDALPRRLVDMFENTSFCSAPRILANLTRYNDGERRVGGIIRYYQSSHGFAHCHIYQS